MSRVWTALVVHAGARRGIALLLPVVVLGLVYLLLVSPRLAAARAAAAESEMLGARLAAVQAHIAAVPPTSIADTRGAGAFERRVPAEDRTPELLERLARLALGADGSVTNLAIDTGERHELQFAGGPRVASPPAELPDPRLALFAERVAYRPIMLRFDAPYAALGGFLWRLRDLTTAVEIRSLDVKPSAEGRPGAPLLHVEIVLYAYQRVSPRA